MSALIIHRRSSLLCYFSDRDGGLSVAIPPEAMADMEILNEELYIQAVTKMVEKIRGPMSAVLVLADEMCYFAQTTSDKIEAVTKQLSDNTPFSYVQTAVIRNANQVFVVATNADVYEAAVRAFAAHGITITMVVPWGELVAQKIIVSGEIDRITVKRLFDATQTIKDSTFPLMTHDHPIISTKEKDTKEKQRSSPVGWIVFGLFALAYAIGMIWYMVRQ